MPLLGAQYMQIETVYRDIQCIALLLSSALHLDFHVMKVCGFIISFFYLKFVHLFLMTAMKLQI